MQMPTSDAECGSFRRNSPSKLRDPTTSLPIPCSYCETIPTRQSARFCDQCGQKLTRTQETAYQPGVELSGPLTWASGRFVVLGGEASVVLSIDSEDVEVACLSAGDSYGWEAPNADWSELQPRLVVRERLRVRQDVSLKTEESLGLSGRLGDLWSTTSPTPMGLATLGNTFLKAQFLTSLWVPMLDKFSKDLAEMWRKKSEKGLSANACFLLSGAQIAGCCRYTKQLTDVWYGSDRGGNLSAFHIWFMKSMQVIGVMAYRMDSIKQERTSDRWAIVVDGAARAAALKAAHSGGGASAEVSQKQGRSAIDNTVLRNLYTPSEARVMLVGKQVKKALRRFITFRQIAVLRKLSELMKVAPADLGFDIIQGRTILRPDIGEKYRLIRSLLHTATPEDFKSMGIDTTGFAVEALMNSGMVLESTHQLAEKHRKTIDDAVRKLLDIESAEPNSNSDNVFERYVAWNRDKPGEFFDEDKSKDRLVRFAGHFSNQIIMFRRSEVEKMTMAKYYPLKWRRQHPLWGVWPDKTVQVRNAGVTETSNVRANEAPYCDLHGMSLSGGAFVTDDGENSKPLKTPKNSSPEVNAIQYSQIEEFQMVNDPTANLENWFFTDIEKILNEAWQLNPNGPKDMLLPWEGYVNVGQNPKVGSSIKRTQHTQLCEGSLSKYPVFQLSTNPRVSVSLDATLDLVEIGPEGAPPEACGFFTKLTTKRPTGSALIDFLVKLRRRLLESLGGAEVIDFFVMCMSDEEGGYVVIFACLPQLEKLGEESPDFAAWKNPITGESTEDVGLHEARIDFGKGVGHFLVQKPELRTQILECGESIVRRIWAFNRVPSSRKIIEDFIAEQRPFEASPKAEKRISFAENAVSTSV